MKKLILSEESLLNTEFDTAEANRAKVIAADMLRHGYIPRDLKRLASLLDPTSKPLARSITLGEADIFSPNRHVREKSRKLLASTFINIRIMDQHRRNKAHYLESNDSIWKGVTKEAHKRYRIKAIKDLAALWECSERTIYRYLKNDN